ncbi:MAG: hypothetical protein MUO82_11355, partial [Candidatus Thermoplasmatota archaeon]|nr:hypothetical protein [Candidatus Thermoplasmatota archaeon]
MKKIIGILICMLFIGASFVPSIIVNVKAEFYSNPIEYLSFDEIYGNTFHDTAGYDNTDPIYSATWISSRKINVLFKDDEIDQKQEQNCGWGLGIAFPYKLAQSFTPTMPILTRVQLYCWQMDDLYEGVKVSIRSSLYGKDLTTSFKDKLPESGNWVEFDFDDLQVIPGKEYYIIWGQVGGGV